MRKIKKQKLPTIHTKKPELPFEVRQREEECGRFNDGSCKITEYYICLNCRYRAVICPNCNELLMNDKHCELCGWTGWNRKNCIYNSNIICLPVKTNGVEYYTNPNCKNGICGYYDNEIKEEKEKR